MEVAHFLNHGDKGYIKYTLHLCATLMASDGRASTLKYSLSPICHELKSLSRVQEGQNIHFIWEAKIEK